MKSKRPDWVTNPDKKHILLYSGLWITGVSLILLAATNFFTETPFIRKNILFPLLVIFSLVPIIQMIRNYFANKENQTNNTHFQNQ